MAAEHYEGEALVYVGTYTDDPDEGIYHFRMDLSTGAIEAAGVTREVPNPFFLTIDGQGRRLYAANGVDETEGEPGGTVSAFSIDAETGALTFLNRQLSCGAFPCYLSIDRSEQNLLVGNYNSGSVAVLPIVEEGWLGPATDAVQHEGSSLDGERQDGPHVHSVVLDPEERHAFVADLGIDKVFIYPFDSLGGRFMPEEPSSVGVTAGAGPRHFRFHPSGRYAYLINELSSVLTVFDYDRETGSLTEVQSVSALPSGFDGTNYAADVKILPSGDFLYSSNRGHDSIAIFAIDQYTGRLTEVGYEPAGGSWPWDLAIDPTSRFLLAANQRSDNVVVFRIEQAKGRLMATGYEARVPRPVSVELMQRR